MCRMFAACAGLVLCFWLASSQPQDADYWHANFVDSPAQHAYPASFYAVSEASHFLADRYWQQQQRARSLAYYQRAVDQGDAAAAYSLAQRIPAQREQWLQAAVELGDPRATLTIAGQLRASEPATAIAMLSAVPETEPRNQMLASLLFNHPHLGASHNNNWQRLAPPGPVWQRRLLQAAAFSSASGYAIPHDGQCDGNVTLYYHSDKARSRAYDWLHKLEAHPFAQLGLCFTQASVAQQSQYQCDRDAVGRARCQPTGSSTDADFHIHVVDAGIANVRANHMAIAQTASFDIFIHEMAHLFSLADEYSMREELAEAFCSGRYRFEPLNLVITPVSMQTVDWQTLESLRASLPWSDYLQQPIAVVIPGQAGAPVYQLGSPSAQGVGLFKVDTCKGTQYQAWRPVAEITFMQQHELGGVPEVYVELIRQYLQARR